MSEILEIKNVRRNHLELTHDFRETHDNINFTNI